MNMKNSILLLDPEFDPNTAPDCNLLLRITKDSFSYAIINQDSKSLKAIYDQQESNDIVQTLKDNIKNDPYLKYPFKEVKIAVSSDNCVNIPNEFYNFNELNAYTNFFSTEPSKKLHIKSNAHFNFTTVFNLQQGIEEALDTNFLKASKLDQHAPVLALATQLQDGLLLDFTALSFTAVLVNAGKLIFKNSFEIENAEEFNYYLLLLVKKLEITPLLTEVYVSGIINENDKNHHVIKKYFQLIQFNLPQNKEIECVILEDMPAYYYSSLLAIDLCV